MRYIKNTNKKVIARIKVLLDQLSQNEETFMGYYNSSKYRANKLKELTGIKNWDNVWLGALKKEEFSNIYEYIKSLMDNIEKLKERLNTLENDAKNEVVKKERVIGELEQCKNQLKTKENEYRIILEKYNKSLKNRDKIKEVLKSGSVDDKYHLLLQELRNLYIPDIDGMEQVVKNVRVSINKVIMELENAKTS